ncbi:MAG: hypothetical protein LWX83_09275 [Anaerolineae bacterium]|nr:hypothetical protein [Anaerolineae bacterium]
MPWIELAIEKNILLAPAHYLHGVILQENGEHQRGLAAFRKCLFADPKFLLAYFSMAGLFRKLSQPQKAVSTLLKLEEILKQYPMEDKVPSGDGITISQLFDFVSKQKELIKNGI